MKFGLAVFVLAFFAGCQTRQFNAASNAKGVRAAEPVSVEKTKHSPVEGAVTARFDDLFVHDVSGLIPTQGDYLRKEVCSLVFGDLKGEQGEFKIFTAGRCTTDMVSSSAKPSIAFTWKKSSENLDVYITSNGDKEVKVGTLLPEGEASDYAYSLRYLCTGAFNKVCDLDLKPASERVGKSPVGFWLKAVLLNNN